MACHAKKFKNNRNTSGRRSSSEDNSVILPKIDSHKGYKSVIILIVLS